MALPLRRISKSVTVCQHCQHLARFDVSLPPEPHDDPRLHYVDVPPAEELKECVEETRAHLDSVRRSIKDLEMSLQELRSMETELQTLLPRQTTYFAPIRRVPVDKLVIIFSIACANAPRDPFRLVALDIWAVCKLWHVIMENNPLIWTNTTLPALWPLWGRRRRDRLLAGLDHCLQAMQGLPIACAIDASSPGSSYGRITHFDQDNFQMLFNLLARHSDQWQHLRLETPCPSRSLLTQILRDHSFSRLSTLHLDPCMFDEALGENSPPLDAPALREVHLQNSDCEHLIVPPLSWSNIRKLVTSSTYDYAKTVLLWCDSLVHWTHWNYLPRGRASSGLHQSIPTEVELPHLQTMHIIGLDEQKDLRELDCITAPALRSLRVESDGGRNAVRGDRPFLPAFFSRSKCPSDTLVLERMPADERMHLPSQCDLRNFALVFPSKQPITDVELAVLSRVSNDGKPAISPRLESLLIGGYGQFRGEALVEVVEARRSAGCPLRALHLIHGVIDRSQFGNSEFEGIVDQLRRLVPDFKLVEEFHSHFQAYRAYIISKFRTGQHINS
ncbi:hypothetical protein EV714DRAFT_205710 [Schizophyllum commune]